MSDCIFCKIVSREIPAEIVYEDAHFIGIVDISPNNLGHSLLIPRVHTENVYTLFGESLNHLGEAIQKLSLAVKKATNADGINVHMNNESAAGQVIFHQHTHIIPRFKDDGLKHFAQREDISPEEIKEIGEKIRNALEL